MRVVAPGERGRYLDPMNMGATYSSEPGAATGGGPTTNIHEVKFVLQGSELVGAIKIQTDRLGRVVGR